MPWPVSRLISSLFQSTLLIRGATHDKSATSSRYQISIHAPHTRSDTTTRQQVAMSCAISIHAPHTRSDGQGSNTDRSTVISIHAPHTRSDPLSLTDVIQGMIVFQSTLLIRGATLCTALEGASGFISIHAPHTRSDIWTRFYSYQMRYFNPRSSYEERRPFAPLTSSHCGFQSTLLIRGATSPRAAHFRASKFQSTLLIRGATRKVFSSTALASLFQSTLLIRGATSPFCSPPMLQAYFNPRSSYEERQLIP